jgi:hypothetical protein
MNTPFKSSRLEVVSSVSVVPEEPWNALARETFYTSHRWLEFVERQPGASSEYVLAWHGDALAAGLPCYEIRTEDNQFCDPVRLIDGRWRGEYLIAGPRRGCAATFPLRPVAAGTRSPTWRSDTAIAWCLNGREWERWAI